MVLDFRRFKFLGFLLPVITFLFIFLPFNKVSALETTSGTYPDIPEGVDNFIIATKSDGSIRMFAWKSTATVYVYNYLDSYFSFTKSLSDLNSLNTTDVSVYNLTSNEWVYSKKTGSSTWLFETVIATTVDMYSNGGGFPYEAGYGLIDSSNEFNEDIDVTDISKIKINFELPEDTSNLGLELDFSIKGLTENAGTIGAPYVSLTSKDENNYDQVNIIDFDYGVEERAILISNMCNIVDCWDTFDSTKYSATFETCINNLEQIDSNNTNKISLINKELSNWYTEEYVDKLYDYALSLVDKTYIYSNNYSGNLFMSLLPDSTTYKYSLEIDIINYQGALNLNFISNLNYNIEYEYVVDNIDYYVTIDINDYAALVLVPKVYYSDSNTSASFLSDIYLYGTYDIELWEDLESKNVLYRYNNYNNNVFSHYFDYHYKSSILYFINKNLDSDSFYIKFDSRYYNYVLKNSLNEEVTITNPNTGEDMIIPDISDLYNYDYYYEDVSSYLDSLNKTSDYFNYHFDLNWNKLPSALKSMILFIFNIICILIVLRLGGFK